jgi:hypothetical protein
LVAFALAIAETFATAILGLSYKIEIGAPPKEQLPRHGRRERLPTPARLFDYL